MGKDERTRLKSMGLHYCSYYQNIVKWNPEFCGSCPYNGRNNEKEIEEPAKCK